MLNPKHLRLLQWNVRTPLIAYVHARRDDQLAMADRWASPGNFGEGDSITAGIDIARTKGATCQSQQAAGIVVYAGSGVRGYGNLILLKHNDEFLSAYAHNDSLNVSENDVVEAGEVIATMGNSDAESVRLHFEVRRDGQPQDPMEFLPAR